MDLMWRGAHASTLRVRSLVAEDGGVPGVGRDDTLRLALLVVFPVIGFEQIVHTPPAALVGLPVYQALRCTRKPTNSRMRTHGCPSTRTRRPTSRHWGIRLALFDSSDTPPRTE